MREFRVWAAACGGMDKVALRGRKAQGRKGGGGLTEIKEPVGAGGEGVGFLAGFDGVDFGGVELFWVG